MSHCRRLRKASAIAWNPAIALQVVVASGDDRCPTLQMWDLRKAHPVQELLGQDKVGAPGACLGFRDWALGFMANDEWHRLGCGVPWVCHGPGVRVACS